VRPGNARHCVPISREEICYAIGLKNPTCRSIRSYSSYPVSLIGKTQFVCAGPRKMIRRSAAIISKITVLFIASTASIADIAHWTRGYGRQLDQVILVYDEPRSKDNSEGAAGPHGQTSPPYATTHTSDTPKPRPAVVTSSSGTAPLCCSLVGANCLNQPSPCGRHGVFSLDDSSQC
jgi:hypothetical protein